jgi:signal transduction histidine kinase
MELIIGFLILLIILLSAYIALLFREQRSINRQLSKRLNEHNRQPIRVEFINKELSQLVENINKSLKAEEVLRLNGVREEKRSKELIADISHDLRTPLTAIKGYQQLMNHGELPPDQRKKHEIAMKHADDLGVLLDHFFEYSYFLNAEPKLKLERINLTNLVTECIAAAVPAIEERGFMIRIAETKPVFSMADQDMTLRIIQNLIRNCEAHSTGDVDVQILALDKAIISFTNPVANASQIDTKRIFERFYTADRARSKSTGLGLSIVTMLAEQMGGRVSAQVQGNALTILVELPLDTSI